MDFGDTLADRIIARNKAEAELDEKLQDLDSPYDELGLLKPQPSSARNPFAVPNYIVARIMKLNPHLYNHRGSLYLKNRMIAKNMAQICELANWPDNIKTAWVVYIHKTLMRVTPTLDTTRIEVLPGLIWDSNIGQLVHMDPSEYNTT